MKPNSIDIQPLDLPDVLKAYFAEQPRAIRFFGPDLEVRWDNCPDREGRFPVYRDESGAVLSVPQEGLQRWVWPVTQVSRGAERSERLYKLEPPAVTGVQCFRVLAWPLPGPDGTQPLVVEEVERVEAEDCRDHRIGQLDKEVENLLQQIVEHLQQGRAGDVLRLRLANPNVRKCRELRECHSGRCPAFMERTNLRCWEIPDTFCPEAAESQDILTKFRYCHQCEVFVAACPDPLTRVAENFNRLISLLQLKYHEALEMQRQLQQSEKLGALGELLAGIAHEIKNPLGILLGRLDVLSLEMEDPARDDVADDFEVIRSQAARVQHIIDHLLRMARPGPLETRSASLNEIIIDTLPMVRKTLQNANVHLETRLASELPSVDVDVIHIQQVLLNLILNARDAMPEGGLLSITTERNGTDPPGILVLVRDTGVGMTTEQLKAFSTPFFTTKLEQGGTGLGLAMCQRIMRQHKGRMDAESQLNKGTVMQLWFPIRGAAG